VCAQVTLTKTGLSTVRTFSPLGVNFNKKAPMRFLTTSNPQLHPHII
jgi:hypothetical protein